MPRFILTTSTELILTYIIDAEDSQAAIDKFEASNSNAQQVNESYLEEDIIAVDEDLDDEYGDINKTVGLSPEALKRVQQGLKDATEGKIKSLGDFTCYIEEET